MSLIVVLAWRCTANYVLHVLSLFATLKSCMIYEIVMGLQEWQKV